MIRFLLVLLWVLYLIAPYDLIPDLLPGLGRLDDLFLLGYLYWNYFRKATGSRSWPHGEHTGAQPRSENTGYGAGGSTNAEKPRSPRDPYLILGVERTASIEEIRQAYRTQAGRYHPDKVTHLGEEFQVLAKERFQEIQWAYESLMKRHGVA
jgi:hypothetical protein